MNSLTLEELKIGQKVTVERTLTPDIVLQYANATGDQNPIHMNEEFAAGTKFGRRIVHGMLLGGIISSLLGTCLPGSGCIYEIQNLRFRTPVYVGDTIIAEVEVISLNPERRRVTLRTICRGADGNIAVDGEAVLLPKRNMENRGF
jgi:3-hydroxybutyryl-CoA dehydratase